MNIICGESNPHKHGYHHYLSKLDQPDGLMECLSLPVTQVQIPHAPWRRIEIQFVFRAKSRNYSGFNKCNSAVRTVKRSRKVKLARIAILCAIAGGEVD